jgi:hypothetical protein
MLAVLLGIVIDLYDNFRRDRFSSGSLGNVSLKKAETHVICANLLLSQMSMNVRPVFTSRSIDGDSLPAVDCFGQSSEHTLNWRHLQDL